MTLTQHEPMMCQRAESLGKRMLGGEAAASFTAYQLGEDVPFAAHCVFDGRLLVSCQLPQNSLLSAIRPGQLVAVRIDLTKQAPMVYPAIEVASAHMLAELRWLDRNEAAELVGELPELVRVPLESADGRLGVLSGDRLVIHDFAGISAFDLPERLVDSQYRVPDLLDACDEILSLGEHRLREICWEVMTDARCGAVSVLKVDGDICASLSDRVFCVDADYRGMTLICTGSREMATVFVQFDEQVTTRESFRSQIARLK